MTTGHLAASELILNKDGSVYHLGLKAKDVASTVILVGDPGRVERVSRHFDSIDFRQHKREFCTHTGSYHGKKISVISSGIGPDNIDIVVNELDAAINIDPDTRQVRSERRVLDIIRIGTSGGITEEVSVGSFVLAEYGLGFDGVMHYYDYPYTDEEKTLSKAIVDGLQLDPKMAEPYITKSCSMLADRLGQGMHKGITATALGFYGPQGRQLYLRPKDPTLNDRMRLFNYNGHRITNFEMETSALYGLGRLLGHQCCTCCAIVANRYLREYADNHMEIVESLIKTVLDRLVER